MVKIIGMILVFGGATAIGFYLPGLLKKKLEFLVNFRQSVYLLRNEINYSINTLVVSFLNIFERSNNQYVKNFFLEIYEQLENKDSVNLRNVWEVGIDDLSNKEIINENEKKYLKSFGNSLGYLDKEMQLKNIDLLIESLDESIKRLKENYEKHSKLYSRMGILVGLMVVVVMF
ncbi:MAG: hypothetical protein A2Y24_03115 [Clostridiales bacterium GWE2_32_10]|nr:MAG: hypothetical protein A2Y24_03115 [Clostridiales bacterium GWE2_32_10]HBY19945.1 hypothetical protein [Clostridiales bacterium]